MVKVGSSEAAVCHVAVPAEGAERGQEAKERNTPSEEGAPKKATTASGQSGAR